MYICIIPSAGATQVKVVQKERNAKEKKRKKREGLDSCMHNTTRTAPSSSPSSYQNPLPPSTAHRPPPSAPTTTTTTTIQLDHPADYHLQLTTCKQTHHNYHPSPNPIPTQQHPSSLPFIQSPHCHRYSYNYTNISCCLSSNRPSRLLFRGVPSVTRNPACAKEIRGGLNPNPNILVHSTCPPRST